MTPKEVPPVVSQGSFHPLAEVHYGCGGKEVEVQHLMMRNKDANFDHMNFTEFFVGSASQAVPHVRDNESKGTSTIVSGAAKWSLVISLDPTVVEVVILIDKDTLKITRTWLLERCFCQQWRGQPQDLEVLEAFRIWKSGSLDITELTNNTSCFGNPFFKAGASHHSRGPTFPNSVCAHVCIVMINTKAKLRKQLLQKAWPPDISRPNTPHATHVFHIVFGPLG